MSPKQYNLCKNAKNIYKSYMCLTVSVKNCLLSLLKKYFITRPESLFGLSFIFPPIS